jgi:Fe-S-cluster-containing dehydrogenase component
MDAKLIIDLAKCDLQENTSAKCSYNQHPENKGVDSLLEMIRFALICRRCEAAPCVKACPNDALEKLPSNYSDAGVLKRHNMRCTGCGTCAIACPFGTIYTDLIPYPSSVCDLCKNRLESNGKPLCVNTCGDGSIECRRCFR